MSEIVAPAWSCAAALADTGARGPWPQRSEPADARPAGLHASPRAGSRCGPRKIGSRCASARDSGNHQATMCCACTRWRRTERVYLQRPDLGRRLDEASHAALTDLQADSWELAFVIVPMGCRRWLLSDMRCRCCASCCRDSKGGGWRRCAWSSRAVWRLETRLALRLAHNSAWCSSASGPG